MAKTRNKRNGQADSAQPILDQVEETPAPALALNPFDPERLRLRGVESLGTQKVLTTVPCGKPNKHQFVRVHPEESYRMETAIFEDKNLNESYLVSPEMWSELSLDVTPVCLFTATTRHGDCFLWQVKLPGADGRSNTWNESAMAASQLAIDHWVRVASNMQAGRYDVFQATGALPDPEWPSETFQGLLERCFEKRIIQNRLNFVSLSNGKI